MEPDAAEIRVIGCLIEKQRTTPDAYPLTVNSIRLACNQSTNRDPVVSYDEETVRRAIGALSRRRWIRLASGHTSRTAKYRQLLDSELGLAEDEISLLGVMMLRGAQTPGELKQRAGRLHPFESLAAVHETLERLIERELVERLPRRPGQKEERFEQRLGGGEDAEARNGDAQDLAPGSPEDRQGVEAEAALATDPPPPPPVRIHTEELRFSTGGDSEIVDITAEVQRVVSECGAESAQALAFVRGSTAAITTMEFEPGGVRDLQQMLERVIPAQGDYEHNRLNHDTNSHAHQRASIVGPSETVPVIDGRLALGTWQQLVLIDFDDRARERTVIVQVAS